MDLLTQTEYHTLFVFKKDKMKLIISRVKLLSILKDRLLELRQTMYHDSPQWSLVGWRRTWEHDGPTDSEATLFILLLSMLLNCADPDIAIEIWKQATFEACNTGLLEPNDDGWLYTGTVPLD